MLPASLAREKHLLLWSVIIVTGQSAENKGLLSPQPQTAHQYQLPALPPRLRELHRRGGRKNVRTGGWGRGSTVKRCPQGVVWPFNLQTPCSCLDLKESVDSPMGNFSWTQSLKQFFLKKKKREREGNVLGRLKGESRGRIFSRCCLNIGNDPRINKSTLFFF